MPTDGAPPRRAGDDARRQAPSSQGLSKARRRLVPPIALPAGSIGALPPWRQLITHYLTDEIGSVRVATDAFGRESEEWRYDAFGVAYEEDFGDAHRYGYAGKPYDEETCAYDYGFRDYAAPLGRFLTVDPIRDGTNWYAYCGNDPVNRVDLWGLSASDKVKKFTDPLGLQESGKSNSVLAGTKDMFSIFNSVLKAAYSWELGKVTAALPVNIPPEVSVDLNMGLAKSMDPFTWKSLVENKGSWYYKQIDPKYEDFGNFNYGSTGTKLGIPAEVLLRAAGYASVSADPKRKDTYSSPLDMNPPYGDDPADAYWIIQGVKYARSH